MSPKQDRVPLGALVRSLDLGFVWPGCGAVGGPRAAGRAYFRLNSRNRIKFDRLVCCPLARGPQNRPRLSVRSSVEAGARHRRHTFRTGCRQAAHPVQLGQKLEQFGRCFYAQFIVQSKSVSDCPLQHATHEEKRVSRLIAREIVSDIFRASGSRQEAGAIAETRYEIAAQTGKFRRARRIG